ncbi:MAG: CDP-diacylglycerol--glycerol-3-phosphate 3-phosphatidyltransferase [Acidimicrobiia bacterium]|nr:CDP-diacylglycerol--glycerol-3-phosphate 3-phosphatidyltransferase [Acidimicrobiia bacterium]
MSSIDSGSRNGKRWTSSYRMPPTLPICGSPTPKTPDSAPARSNCPPLVPRGENRSAGCDPVGWGGYRYHRHVCLSRKPTISVPDYLALSRVASVPFIMAFALASVEHHLGIAAGVFAFAGATDFFDGYLARRWKVESTLGAFLDTTADKILVTGSLLALIAIDRASIWAAFIIIVREFSVMALRGVVAIEGGFVRPSTWGKIKAAVQFLAIFLAFLRLPSPWGPLYLDEWVMWIAVIVTMASFWGYVSGFLETMRADRKSS